METTFDLGAILIAAVAVIIAYVYRRRRRVVVPVPEPAELKIEFNQDNERWEVRNSGKLAGRLIVRRGQTITWDLGGTTARFDFPTVLFGAENETRNESTLTLNVSSNAPLGRYVYAVNIDGQYAEGGTPPDMEVEDY